MNTLAWPLVSLVGCILEALRTFMMFVCGLYLLVVGIFGTVSYNGQPVSEFWNVLLILLGSFWVGASINRS